MSVLLLLVFIIALHESDTRKALLGPWLNNTDVYLAPLIVLKITQFKDISHLQ